MREQVRVGVEEYSDDAVGRYLREIRHFDLLNAEQEVELAKDIEAGLVAEKLLGAEFESAALAEMQAKSGTYPTSELESLVEIGRQAKQTFINANLRLVVSCAKRYTRSGHPLLDLVQEGNVGLIRSVEKFDYKKGYKFSTYATWWIGQSLGRYTAANTSDVVHFAVHTGEDVKKLRMTEHDMTLQFGRPPTAEELSEFTGISVKKITELRRFIPDGVRMDAPAGEDGSPLSGLLPDKRIPHDEQLILSVDIIDRLKTCLTEHQFDIVVRAFGLDGGGQEHRASRIANELDISGAAVSRRLSIAIGVIRKSGIFDDYRHSEGVAV